MGDKLLSDGLRVVPTFADLPSISDNLAAEGVIYFVTATKIGYVLPRGGSEWLQVIYAPTTNGGAEVDLSDYYTKAEVDEAILDAIANINIEVDLTGLATEAYVAEKIADIEGLEVPTKISELENDAGFITEHQDISHLATKEEIADIQEQIANIPTTDLTGYATEEFVLTKIAEAELADKDVDLTQYYTKSEVDELIPDISDFATREELQEAINSIEHPSIDLTDYATKEEIAAVEAKIPSVEGLATKQELEDAVSAIEHPTVDLTGYATEDYVKVVANTNKYEVLPMEGMFVQYNDNEVRVNTEHVDISSLPPQNAGDGSSDSYYYMTFRAYAPEGATSVIEGQSDKMDEKHSELAVDSYGRKYTTIWSAIASKSNNTWTKYGDMSNKGDRIGKYLGFYYNFHWYNGDKLLSKEKVRVILTNDSCHNDLVPDAVARRIDEKVADVNTIVNSLNTAVENIENNYVQNETLESYVTNEYIQTQNFVTNNYIEQNYSTTEQIAATYVTEEKVTEVVTNEVNTVVTEQIETKVTEVIQEKVEAGEISVKADVISYDTW